MNETTAKYRNGSVTVSKLMQCYLVQKNFGG